MAKKIGLLGAVFAFFVLSTLSGRIQQQICLNSEEGQTYTFQIPRKDKKRLSKFFQQYEGKDFLEATLSLLKFPPKEVLSDS